MNQKFVETPALPQWLHSLAGISTSRLVPLLWEDQRQRWQRGERPTVEMYMRGLPPEVAHEVAVDLVYGEYVLRKEAGERLQPEDFINRFPDQATAIRRQLAFDDGISESGIATTTVGALENQNLDDDLQSSPTELAGYRVVAPLGSGGQGTVYRGVHPTLRRDVVIKVGNVPVGDEGEAEALIQEGRVLAELDHPGLARVYDFKLHQGFPCLVMEFIRGRTLEQVCKDPGHRRSELVRFVAEVARALAEVHRRGVIHRDIKPSNILIDDAGKPKLIDFGLARCEDAWRHPANHPGFCGTVSFMAPEQARGEPATPRSDLFGLGAVLYYVLTSKAPYRGANFAEIRTQAERGDWDRQALVERRVPARLRAVVERAMAVDPQDRYASAAELAADLEAASRPHFRWTWVAPLVAAAALVALGIGLWPMAVPVPPRDFSLKVRVWDGKHFVDLDNRLPIQNGNELRLESLPPAKMHAALFLASKDGIKLLAAAPPFAEETRFEYPAKIGASVPLQGAPGNELVLLCARRSGPVTKADVADLLAAFDSWPTLQEGSVFRLAPGQVKAIQSPRDFGPIRGGVDPEGEVLQKLEDLQHRLKGRLDYFEGLIFSHER
jgi:predicted Ser/Thr protein kinase